MQIFEHWTLKKWLNFKLFKILYLQFELHFGNWKLDGILNDCNRNKNQNFLLLLFIILFKCLNFYRKQQNVPFRMSLQGIHIPASHR